MYLITDWDYLLWKNVLFKKKSICYERKKKLYLCYVKRSPVSSALININVRGWALMAISTVQWISNRVCATIKSASLCSPCVLMKLMFSFFFQRWNHPTVTTKLSFLICFARSSAFWCQSDPLLRALFFLNYNNRALKALSTNFFFSRSFLFPPLPLSFYCAFNFQTIFQNPIRSKIKNI